jgi:hypothetical protein
MNVVNNLREPVRPSVPSPEEGDPKASAGLGFSGFRTGPCLINLFFFLISEFPVWNHLTGDKII